MSLTPDASSPYRRGTTPRVLSLRVGAPWTTTLLGALVGVVFLGAAASTFLAHCSVEWTRRTWVHEGCVPHAEDRVEAAPATLGWFFVQAPLRAAPVGDESIFAEHLRVGRDPGPAVLLLMALVAFAGPSLLTERARFVLDEADGRVRIRRSRLGRVEVLERPLADLRQAVLVRRGWTTAVELQFRGSEELPLCAPTHGDAGHARLVTAVTDFLATRA